MNNLEVKESITVPKEYQKYLGQFNKQIFDGWSGEPIMWGYPIISRCGDEIWKQLGKLGTLEYASQNWFLITKKLTREEAINLYGEITNEEFGPRGGWKSVTFGEKKFISKYLQPEK